MGIPKPPNLPTLQEEHPPDLKKGALLEIDTTREITTTEHNLPFWSAVRQYPLAVFWAMFFCIAVIMAGFDAQLVTSFYALPAFQARYGVELSPGNYEISAPWQTALGMGNPIGQALGALACGWPLERFGRKKTLATCCVWSICFVFVQFFSTSIGMLCAGEILGGLAYGFYVVIAPTYASEICPLALRGVLTASVNLAFVIGQFIAQGCAAGVESRLDEWAYKAPFVSFGFSCFLFQAARDIKKDLENDSHKFPGHSMDLARRPPLRAPLRTRKPLLADPAKPQRRSPCLSPQTFFL
jgi:SP family general alpha glucoside:H+ symporter-like MFS transporter